MEIVTSRQPEFESMLIPRGATLLLWQLHVLWIVLMNFIFCIAIAIVFDFDFANVFIENTVKYGETSSPKMVSFLVHIFPLSNEYIS